MWEKLIEWALPKTLKDASTGIQKTNLMYNVLGRCYKIEILKNSWEDFISAVIALLSDWVDECEQARKWGK